MISAPADRHDPTMAAVIAAEMAWFDARRASVADADPGLAAAMAAHPGVGLALSGGGIRSATFSLGMLQALSRSGCLRGIDYLSTVSGGSYIGAFFGALFIAPEDRHGPALNAAERREFLADPLGCERGQTATARLREFGRYLTPGGASDMAFGASLVARNWLALQIVLGFVPLALFLALRWAATLGGPVLDNAPLLVTPGSIILLGIALAVWCLGCGLAAGYWFSRKEQAVYSRLKRIATPLFGVAVVATAIAAWRLGTPDLPGDLAWAIGVAIPALAIVSYTAALLLHGKASAPPGASARDRDLAALQAEEQVRARMTRWLARVNVWLGCVLALAAINMLGERLLRTVVEPGHLWQQVVDRNHDSNLWAAVWEFIIHFWPLLAAIAPLAFTIWTHRALRRGTGSGWLARPAGQTALGISIVLLWLAVWAAIAAAIIQFSGVAPYIALAAVCGLIIVQSLMYGFLNLSSLVTLYSARLKRAYIGASNPSPDPGGYDTDLPGNLVPMETYYGAAPSPGAPAALVHARPLHLINATIAQTEPEGASNVVAYDRKGKPLHLSPAGVVGGTPAGGNAALRPFADCEALTLSDWTAISGAAASTAIGAIGTAGLSVLAMMTNVRLGFWWKSQDSGCWTWPRHRGDTVLGYLYSEMAMKFDTSRSATRRWYLTDGGHFENTGAYALLQRGLKFILVCDNGADPDYRADDFVRLLQRARTDLGAEITFLDAAELDAVIGGHSAVRGVLGAYDELIAPPDKTRKGGPYAALARIRYRRAAADGGRDGWLMLIKPRLNFTEPPELLAYRQKEAGQRFPQQTTLDQFFDEDQWEAYRRFGEVVGERLFAPTGNASPGGWLPGDFLRLQTGLP